VHGATVKKMKLIPHRKNMGIHITKTNHLMLVRDKKIGVYPDNYTIQIIGGCGKIKELNVKSMWYIYIYIYIYIYSNHCVLKR
jgi:hypothetical protein